jgi:FAD/FMN-containing dehydrogenase
VAACRTHGAPVLPRGAGTSLAGQCCNVAVVLDFTKYLNRISSSIRLARRARVQPGVVLDTLRTAAESHQLTFGPDPSTHSRCTLGGMIGNNSCGTHSLLAGKTVDNVESLRVLLYDGTELTVGATSEERARRDRRPRAAAAARIYAGLAGLRDRYASLIRARFPDIPRRVSGYNLDQLLPEHGFHVARALVGSEGTCAVVLEATTGSFRARSTARWSGSATPMCSRPPITCPRSSSWPIGLEGFEGAMVDGLRARARRTSICCPRDAAFCSSSSAPTTPARPTPGRTASGDLARSRRPPHARLYTRRGPRRLEDPRVGPARRRRGPGMPPRYEGWDDAAVAPEKLGAYLRDLRALLDEYGYQAAYYGHFGTAAFTCRSASTCRASRGSGVRRVRRPRGRSGRALRRVDLGRARRRPGARRAAAEDVRPELMEALPRVQGHLGSRHRMNPASSSTRTSADRRPAARRRLRGRSIRPRTSVPRRRRVVREGGAALHRDRRVPQARLRHDVPELHGDARGGAQHARARAPALRDAAGRVP